jgi:hypothetical protein
VACAKVYATVIATPYLSSNSSIVGSRAIIGSRSMLSNPTNSPELADPNGNFSAIAAFPSSAASATFGVYAFGVYAFKEGYTQVASATFEVAAPASTGVTQTGVNVRMARNDATVTGVISPTSGATVQVAFPNQYVGAPVATILPDTSGNYRLDIASGTYQLYAKAPSSDYKQRSVRDNAWVIASGNAVRNIAFPTLSVIETSCPSNQSGCQITVSGENWKPSANLYISGYATPSYIAFFPDSRTSSTYVIPDTGNFSNVKFYTPAGQVPDPGQYSLTASQSSANLDRYIELQQVYQVNSVSSAQVRTSNPSMTVVSSSNSPVTTLAPTGVMSTATPPNGGSVVASASPSPSTSSPSSTTSVPTTVVATVTPTVSATPTPTP